MTEASKRGKGRPRSAPSEGKRYSISTNVSADTRRRLEHSADRNGQSLAKEADDRLRQSLLDDEHMGGGPTAQALRTLAGVVWTIEQASGKKWTEDEFTAVAAEAAIIQSAQTIFHAVALDRIGQLAVMDLMDLQEQRLDPETMKQVHERANLYDKASDFGRKVALGAVAGRVLGDGQA